MAAFMFILVLALPTAVVGSQAGKNVDYHGVKFTAEYPQQKTK